MPHTNQRLSLTFLLLLTVVSTAVFADDRAAVERTVLDYVEAIEQGRPELVERGVHPHLAKFGFYRESANDYYTIYPMSFDELVELSANMKKQGHVPDDAEHSIEIFEVLNQTASVKLTAFWGIDYMHLAKYDGEWKIVQVLWQSHPDKGTAMQATGNFEVQLKPLEVYNQSPDAKIGRLSIDKTFEGDLEATSQGEMLSGGSAAEGSAGYVAIERVTGTLHGKSGSFLLQHTATMTPEAQEATITVVPGSGTGELEGVAGSMGIEIEAGQHSYSFEYTLPAE